MRLKFLPLLLLLACQQQPDPQLTAELTQLRSHEQAQADSLRKLRQQMAYMQQELELSAQLANERPNSEPTLPRQPVKAQPPFGLLYHTPVVARLANEELAEVLSIADSTSDQGVGGYFVKAYRVCNGPSDVTMESCNCSHYVYLALGMGDLPPEYKVFRIGPFFEAEFAGWEEAVTPTDGAPDYGYDGQTILRIRHDIKGRKKTDSFRISWQGVKLL